MKEEEPKRLKDLGYTGFSKLMGQCWKTYNAENMKQFQAWAADDKLRYSKELIEWHEEQEDYYVALTKEEAETEATTVSSRSGTTDTTHPPAMQADAFSSKEEGAVMEQLPCESVLEKQHRQQGTIAFASMNQEYFWKPVTAVFDGSGSGQRWH